MKLNCSFAGAASAVTAINSTTWTGGETFNRPIDLPGNGVQWSFVDASNATGGATDTVTATYSGAAGAGQIVAAAWR
jgi:hypothetical protein